MKSTGSIVIKLPRLFSRAFGRYKLHIGVMSVLSFVNSVLEGIGISAVIPIFSFVANDGVKGTDVVSRTIEKIFGALGFAYNVRNLLIFVGLLFICKVVLTFVNIYLTTRIIANYERSTKISIFKAILRSNWSYLSQQKIGHLDQVMSTNISNICSLFASFSTLTLILAKLIVYSIIAFNISLVITIATLATGLLGFFVFKPLFYRTKSLSVRMEIMNRTISHFINENILGMKTVKSMFVENGVIKKAVDYFNEVKTLALDLAVIRGVTDVLLQAIGVVFILVAFVFFYKTTIFNFAAFAVMVYAVNQIFTLIQSAQAEMHRVVIRLPYLDKLLQYFEETDKYKEVYKKAKHFSFSRQIDFQNVNFSYEAGDVVLENVNFSIKKGEMVGLIGPSGAGKTTVVDLLLRLYRPVSGVILIDGQNLEEIDLHDWRHTVGYVSQDIFLMNDTIANNIRFYNYDLTDYDIIRAARMANIYDFIESCPPKLETVIGERGILLSAGQRQRIIIARVLARQPKLLILDEATSALDNESEIEIQKVIESLKGKITVLAIAHRLSTVIKSDRLMVLDGGIITESGAPQDLLKEKESYFSKVYNLRR